MGEHSRGAVQQLKKTCPPMIDLNEALKMPDTPCVVNTFITYYFISWFDYMNILGMVVHVHARSGKMWCTVLWIPSYLSPSLLCGEIIPQALCDGWIRGMKKNKLFYCVKKYIIAYSFQCISTHIIQLSASKVILTLVTGGYISVFCIYMIYRNKNASPLFSNAEIDPTNFDHCSLNLKQL